ncbi:hypothetical protein [uncultured Treponema sp.]|uniref:hypothetical protein n=1 Tax=uncultured Treponema sp. TaxID=162155 RepID=UPI0025E8FC80|nr:hypothetical protein [uncultured Treponema sp.]
MEQITSPAAQVILALIPIVGITIGGIIIFFALLWIHHEKKQQIKTGEKPKSNFNYKAMTLLSGLLLTGIGAMLSVFFALMTGASPSLLGGLIPLTTGICLLMFYKLYDWHNESGTAVN